MYSPQVVSIGPFHHGKKDLKAMEVHKRRYLLAFLRRIKKSMDEYIEGIKEHEISLLRSYAEINGYNREEFMEMMVVDGAFLMEFLLMFNSDPETWESNDRIFGKQNLRTNVRYDLLLIENQLPFFYLEHLYGLFEKSREEHDDNPSLKNIVQKYLADVSPWEWSVRSTKIVAEHLLDYLIICIGRPTTARTETRDQCNNSLASATIWGFHQAGVKFKPSSSKCLSDIKFSNGILEMPILKLTDKVEMVFRNMQAFEQCHKSGFYISDYISVMDMLINSKKDVKVLVQSKIIKNRLAKNGAAATVFNNLGKGNHLDTFGFSYSRVIEDLNAYYEIRRHKWKAILRQNYFENPWTIISFVAAAFLLLLTITQTVCAILEVL